MIIRSYDAGSAATDAFVSSNRATVELITRDGRTAQVSFWEDGRLSMRAWGNVPAKLGNSNKTAMECFVPIEEPSSCEYCYWQLEKCTCEKGKSHETNE
jgi:hypothetical protein